MGSDIFAMTPVEGAIWHMGVMAQSFLSSEIFGSNVFTALVVLGFTVVFFRSLMAINDGEDSNVAARRVLVHMLLMGLGLMFIRTVNSAPFTTTDAGGRSWVSYSSVAMSPNYDALKRSTDGLYWYTFLHKGAIQVSNVMTEAVGGVFNDKNYPKASNMVFKMLVNTANMAIDDPKVTESLEILAAKCSDTADGRVLDKNGSLHSLFDIRGPDCEKHYADLQAGLRSWVKRRYPEYLKKIEALPDTETHEKLAGLKDRQVLENKIIASALVNYAKSRGSRSDGINTNSGALTLNDKSDHFWFNVQRVVASGAGTASIASMFTDNDTEAVIVRNEAGIIYNNLLNLLPTIRGYVKAFIALAFILCAAVLSMGHTKPMIWWLTIVGMEMLYTPLSALNYEICTNFMLDSRVLTGFGELRNDPMIIAGASLIDGQLARIQTAYFLTQTVIVSMFVFGIVRSGFAVRQMSFAQGSGFTGFATTLSHNRVTGVLARGMTRGAGYMGKGAGSALSKGAGAISRRLSR